MPSIAQAAPIIIGITITVGTWFLNNFIHQGISRLGTAKKIDPSFIATLQQITTVIIYILGGILFLENSTIQIASLLGALGVVTVGVGIALQKIMSNMTCGIFLLLYKPFRIGDYIVSKHFQGKVIEINFRITTLEYQDNIVIVPNHTVYNAIIMIKKS